MTGKSRLTTASGQILLLAGGAGLLAGVVEGLIWIVLARFGRETRVPVEILSIAPAFDLALFLVVGTALALVARLPKLSARVQDVALVVLLWMLAFGPIHLLGVMPPLGAMTLALGVAVATRRWRPSVEWWLYWVRSTRVPLAVAAGVCVIAGLGWSPWQEATKLEALAPPPSNVPNVLLVTLDTLGAGHVSAHGYSRQTTPNLDQFARRGLLFEHAFANSSWTLPSHASLLTGRYPHEHGADWRQPMAPRIATLATTFAARGYVTAAFAANTSYVTPQWGLGEGFSRFESYGGSLADHAVRTVYGKLLALNVLPRVGYFDIPGRKRAAQLTRDFLTWRDQLNGRPFFALLNYLDVHDPYVTVDPYRTKYSPRPARGNVINFQFQPNAFRRKPALSAVEIESEIDAYDGCVAYLDAELGKLFAELARRDLDRNTLVVITSDHGESFGNHDLFGHGNSLYFETLHVPLVMVWPGHIPSNVRVSGPVGLERIPATISELVDGKSGSGGPFPGRSLASLWTSSEQDSERASEPVLSEVTHTRDGPPAYPTSGGSLTSLLTSEWHLVVSTTGETELYAWPRDRRERVNLAETEQGRTVVADLKRTIQQIHARSPR
jgi:arylsulfatase A-like enzyme